MRIIFSNVNPRYEHMFTAGKEYLILSTHNVYGLRVLTDGEKECWVNPKQSEYGDKEIKEDLQ